MDSRVCRKTWLNVNTCRRQLDINTSRNTATGIPQYTNEDDDDDDNEDVYISTPSTNIFNWISCRDETVLWRVIRHATTRNFDSRAGSTNVTVSHTNDAIFFSCTISTLSHSFSIPTLRRFSNAALCNLWTNRRIDSLIESTWRGRSLFRASARMPCGVSSDNGISPISRTCTARFSKTKSFRYIEFCYRRSSPIRPYSILHVLASALTVSQKMLFSSFCRNFLGLILQFEFRTSAVSNYFRHNLLSFTEFLSCSQTDFRADFFEILLLYLDNIYSWQFISERWLNLQASRSTFSFFTPSRSTVPCPSDLG